MRGGREQFDVSVNQRVKQIRLSLGLSQAKFCVNIPLTSGHYAGIELGNRRVNARLVGLICAHYGVSERFLTAGEGPMFDRSTDYKLEQILRIFRDLPPDFQEYLLRQVEGLEVLAKERK